MGKGKSKKLCMLAVGNNCVLVELIWMKVAKREVWIKLHTSIFFID